jgi:tetratricopeptide (TPR) repeat protein
MVSAAPFLPEFFRRLHPDADPKAVNATFGYRLATNRSDAGWLQPVAYRPPNDLVAAGDDVWLFKVAFNQTEMERLFHIAVARLAGGDLAGAEASLRDTLARIPVDARFAFAESVGAAFYEYDADAAAIRAFRRALEFKSDPGVATTVAWILATTADASVRDGATALALVEPVAMSEPNDPVVLSALGAALADVGRFADAVKIAERAMSVAQAAGEPDSTAARMLQQRLDSYRSNRPWRD